MALANGNMREDHSAVPPTHQSPPALDAFETSSQAFKNGVRTLYKFMNYPREDSARSNDTELRRRVDTLLRDGELYFPTARELNDPFEAAPHFRVPDKCPDDMLETFSRALREKHATEWGWSEEQVLAYENSLAVEINSGLFPVRVRGLAQKWREEYRSSYPMCCLAATRESTLMWSYYASGHTGICVHIDANKVPFGNAMRVVYSKEYPVLPLPVAYLKPEEVTTRALLTKSCVWSHEQEYRVINMPENPRTTTKRILDDVLKWKTPQLAVLPPSHIVGVTVGASMRDKEIETILRVCHDRPVKIPVFQAKCQQDRFDLEFAPIA